MLDIFILIPPCKNKPRWPRTESEKQKTQPQTWKQPQLCTYYQVAGVCAFCPHNFGVKAHTPARRSSIYLPWSW